jgi:hypothetical protein
MSMFAECVQWLRDIHETTWSRVTLPKLGAALGAVALMLMVYVVSHDGWVTLLDSLNLVFHEAGHPIFSVFGHTIGFLGGTIMQLLVPLMVAASAWYKRQAVATALAGVWCFQNGLNIARYMADARAQVLPLVGGGEHDWNTLLGQWGVLDKDVIYAKTLSNLAGLGILLCCAWLGWRCYRDRAKAK